VVDSVKQVILVRRDLNMNRGKEIAQGAHAAMMWLTLRMCEEPFGLSAVESEWVNGLFTKIVLQVPDLVTMENAVVRARSIGLQAYIVEDSGLTQFKGVKTKTCAAIGPDLSSRIDPITHELKLY
jgi:PTH2 family peptidyl-tRNA hydrolase